MNDSLSVPLEGIGIDRLEQERPHVFLQQEGLAFVETPGLRTVASGRVHGATRLLHDSGLLVLYTEPPIPLEKEEVHKVPALRRRPGQDGAALLNENLPRIVGRDRDGSRIAGRRISFLEAKLGGDSPAKQTPRLSRHGWIEEKFLEVYLNLHEAIPSRGRRIAQVRRHHPVASPVVEELWVL